MQLAVHQGHLQFVFIVADGPYAAQHRFGFFLHGIVHQQALKSFNPHILIVLDHLFQHLQPFTDGKQRVFFRVAQHGDDQLIKNLAAPLNQVEVPVGYWIKRTGIDGAH